jgi:hypothetical protein
MKRHRSTNTYIIHSPG